MHRGLTSRFAWKRRLNGVLNWVFPSDATTCAICGRPAFTVGASSPWPSQSENSRLCAFCVQDLERCQVAVERHALQVENAPNRRIDVYSGIDYDAFVRTLFRSFKYDGVIELAPFFTHVLFACWQALDEFACDCIVPVPTAADRIRKRGYDHVRILAERLAGNVQLPVRPALLRVPHAGAFTQSQTAKNAELRRRELEGVFVANSREPIRGRTVLLLDDVATTGATLAACADSLFAFGAKGVIAIVAARVR
ncbi:hypothetical protein Alches_27780 [Alicyclobacillus hesperidum subsp. aegles]|uniref:ComF family protein n=1 Tax=Alicyclobacillus hesperidum TaxID=89784 RepID=UPI00222A3FFE|nr:phosphoribosyltransferase family protein [Alicyclobacillus hesperidum]GLG02737.1 hypothetical protein Alches_27780 [Alicyclobacillus hesperidum subsp. aegles]